MSDNQELNAAIERVRRSRTEPLGAIYMPGAAVDAEELEYVNQMYESDLHTLSMAYLARLDADEKRRADDTPSLKKTSVEYAIGEHTAGRITLDEFIATVLNIADGADKEIDRLRSLLLAAGIECEV